MKVNIFQILIRHTRKTPESEGIAPSTSIHGSATDDDTATNLARHVSNQIYDTTAGNFHDYTSGRQYNHMLQPSTVVGDRGGQMHDEGYNSYGSTHAEFAEVGYIQNDAPRHFNAPQHGSQRHRYARHAQRTVQLFGFGDQVSHADIVKVVRGGMLLDIHLKAHERIANVSFLEASAAQNFMQNVRRNDLYIGGKRVGHE